MQNFKRIIICLIAVLAMGYVHAFAQVDTKPEAGLQHIEIPLEELVGENEMESLSGFYRDDHIMSWSVFVPKAYSPDRPAGVLVYISPTRSGKPPADWLNVLERENIIYISANNAGNRTVARQRLSNAVFALSYVQERYKTDSEITLISGFSGGARMTSTIVEIMPKLFSGAIFVGGAYDWKGVEDSMKTTLKDGTFVFITGQRDHARHETRRNFRAFRDAGVAKVKLIDTHTLAHELPDAKEFADALEFFRK